MRISCYDETNVYLEANRCLSCKNPSCETGCPISNHIRDFIKAVKEKDLTLARKIVYDNSNLAFICSLVCPHEKNCIGHCILNRAKKEPINIGGIEAFITKDFLGEVNKAYALPYKVAIIGAGPAGIYAAIDLAKAGIKPVIYERYNHIGGILSYGIPDFRLNLRELKRLEELLRIYEVEVKLNKEIDELSFKELEKDYDYIIIACGLSKSRPSGLGSGKRIIEANKLLKAYNLKAKYNEGAFPEVNGEVYVMGAGNVAMDCARVLVRLGIKTTIIYRRSLSESPANKEEIEAARSEGVNFRFLENPVKVVDLGHKLEVKIEKMTLGEADASGRRRPVGTGEYSSVQIDYLVEAIGEMPGLILNEIEDSSGYFVTDNQTYQTNKANVYAIGDVTLGAKTVVEACMSGKVVAKSIIAACKK